MAAKFKKRLLSVARPLVGKILFWKKKPGQHVEHIHTRGITNLSPEKQADLDKLCNLLFKKKELITSGKLQLIGLSQIKKRMGKRWAGLNKVVYDTTEDVIRKYMEKGDIFIRYQDDSYIIIFARVSLEDGREKAALIAEEIRKRLFALDEAELRGIEIRGAASQIRTGALGDGGFDDFLAAFDFHEDPQWAQEKPVPAAAEPDELMEVKGVDVNAEDYRRGRDDLPADAALPDLAVCVYLPLWDVKRSALTTYLCLPRTSVEKAGTSLESYRLLCCAQSTENRILLDIKVLEIVTQELALMEREGRQLLIACPVQYETLHNFKSYEHYKDVLGLVPEAQRQYLILYVINPDEKKLPAKDVYWFAAPLRQFCRHVFAELPLRRDINFNYLRNTGVDVAGVRIEGALTSEQETISLLTAMASKARSLKIPFTFVLGVSSLSLTTSAVCAGFDFLGGNAIHHAVDRPDTIHKYRHEDLVSQLIKN